LRKHKQAAPSLNIAHLHEQISTMQQVKFQLAINGVTKILEEGVAVIPSNTKYSGIALTDCKLLDIFYPVREDYKKVPKNLTIPF
jgi:hypothetical protein